MALRLNTSEETEISYIRRFCFAFWNFASAARAVGAGPADLQERVRAAVGTGDGPAAAGARVRVRALLGGGDGGGSAGGSSMLGSGHSAALVDGRHVHICCFVVHRSGAVSAAVRFYRPVARGGVELKHPECRLPWFRRSQSLHLVPMRDIKRREHIVKIGCDATAAGVDLGDHSQFVLNPGIFYLSEAVRSARDVWSSCPRDLCGGRVRHPAASGGGHGAVVQCPQCGLQFRWL